MFWVSIKGGEHSPLFYFYQVDHKGAMKKVIHVFLLLAIPSWSQTNIPHIKNLNGHHQFFVGGQPFLILAGELGNSTATTMENMEPVWPILRSMNLNTVLIPVYWELIEPREGQFDFLLYEKLILESRKQNLKIIFLWFGSWKNSMSSHVPAWIKLNQERFPRVQDETGRSQDILSPFSSNNFEADKRAFVKLMEFIKEVDGSYNTVIMVQVENEIGMLPSARDYHFLAEQEFSKEVPKELTEYLVQRKEILVPEVYSKWKQNGFKTSGSWENVFGKDVATDEIFMAYFFSKFSNGLAKAGKEVYPLPMFVNAALNRPGREPGVYPSAGPLPHIMDIWKAGGSSIDFLSPDIYFPNFEYWSDLYARQGDPLLVPETFAGQSGAANGLFLFAKYGAIGFSPFAIESVRNPTEEPLGKMYALLNEIKTLYFDNLTKGNIYGILINKDDFDKIIRIGKYEFTCKHSFSTRRAPIGTDEIWPTGALMIIQTGENEFYFIGTGVVTIFKLREDKSVNVGLLKVVEGNFIDTKWKVIRHLNGDQTHQGRHVLLPVEKFGIQRVELYTYK